MISQISSLALRDNLLWVGNGPFLEKWSLKTLEKLSTTRLFKRNRIHGIQMDPMIVWGGNSLFIDKEVELSDWIRAVHSLTDGIAVLLSHNVVQILDAQGNLLTSLASDYSNLYSGALFGSTLNELKVAAGTIFNGIKIWSKNGVEKTLMGHTGVVFDISFDSKGHQLLSCSDDRTIRLWSLLEEEHTVFLGHTGRVWKARFYHEWILSCSEDATCRLWNVQGETLGIYGHHLSRNIWCFAVDKQVLITGGGDGAIKRFELFQTDGLKEIPIKEYCKSISFLSETKMVLTLYSGQVVLYDQQTIQAMYQDDAFQSYSVSASYKDLVVIGGLKGKMVALNKSLVKEWSHPQKVYKLFLFENQIFSVSKASGDIHWYTMEPWQHKVIAPVDHMNVESLCWNGQYVVVGTFAGALIVFDCQTLLPIHIVRHYHQEAITDIQLTDDLIITCGRDGYYKKCTLNLEPRQSTQLTKGWLEKLEGDLVTGFYDHEFIVFKNNEIIYKRECGGPYRVWNFAHFDKGKFVFQRKKQLFYEEKSLDSVYIQKPFRGLETTCISSEKDLMITGGEDGVLLCGDSRVQLESSIKCLKRVDDLLFVGGSMQELSSWKIIDRQLIHLYQVPRTKDLESRTMSLDIQNHLLVSAHSNGQLCLWKWQESMIECIQKQEYHKCFLTVRFCGDYILTGSTDGRLLLWNKHLECLVKVKVHEAGLKCMDFKLVPDGVFVLTGGDDGHVGMTKIHFSDFSTHSTTHQRHASATTAVAYVPNGYLSASIDQRLLLTRDQTITEYLLDIPDISGMQVEHINNTLKVTVVGFGIQTLLLDL